MVASYEDCAAMAQAIKAVPGVYQPSDQVGCCLPSGLKRFRAFEIGVIMSDSSWPCCFDSVSTRSQRISKHWSRWRLARLRERHQHHNRTTHSFGSSGRLSGYVLQSSMLMVIWRSSVLCILNVLPALASCSHMITIARMWIWEQKWYVCVISQNVLSSDVLCCFLQNVHHAGQPMPGEEQEDIVMTSTQMSILNVTCPLTGKPVIELIDPVRWYEYNSILYFCISLNILRGVF